MTRARDLADSADKDISGTLVLDDITLSNDISIADNGKAIFGGSNDLQIWHDATAGASKIYDAGAGNLELISNGGGVRFSNPSDEETFNVTNGGATTVYHNRVAKLSTSASGIDVTGNTESDTVTIGASSVAGSEKLRVNGTVLTLGGSVSAPAIGIGDVNTGVYAPTAGQLGWTVNGTQRLFLDNTGVDITGDVGADTATITGKTTTDELDLSPIASTISDTAVDVFVYDTSKDSDGGAWRKRTQGTSWYNETLNTATRGSRKEFPAVAVIVAESEDVTIYDGDDPDLPMWLTFVRSGGIIAYTSIGNKALSMLNGEMQVATPSGLMRFNFLSDIMRFQQGGSDRQQDGITNRQTLSLVNVGNTDYIASSIANDVAMTVLPNAPIDAATGLPVPTIAVATNGGVSVIKDDGTVVDLTWTGGNSYHDIAFSDTYKIIVGVDFSVAAGGRHVKVYDIPESDLSEGSYGSINNALASYGTSSTIRLNAHPTDTTYYHPRQYIGANDVMYMGMYAGYLYTWAGLNMVHGYEDQDTAMLAQVTADYNTGWMNGDIKLATLSDTDDTDVVGSELVTNGTFDSDVSGWSTPVSGYTTFTWSSGTLQHAASGGTGRVRSPAIAVVAGKTYTFSVEVTAKTADSGSFVHLGTSAGASNIKNNITQGEAVGTSAHTFTATTSSVFIELGAINGNTINYDNVSLRLAEEDRSVNGNGLQVFGTVTKSAVATGADLVAYSGFSASGNYLLQSYNSDLDFGTGDFSVTWWMKSGSFSYYDVMARQGTTAVDGGWLVQATPSHMTWYVYASGWKSTYRAVVDADNNIWQQYSFVRRNGKVSFYVNGLYVADTLGTSPNNQDDSMTPSTPIPLSIGRRMDENIWALSNGSIALTRISATAPSPEQIKKIYEDEKHLFQENAQATLHGSSDAVTALAYDDTTELLHVGTSAGRSVFQGLRRVDNTTDAVGAAISASNGLVAED